MPPKKKAGAPAAKKAAPVSVITAPAPAATAPAAPAPAPAATVLAAPAATVSAPAATVLAAPAAVPAAQPTNNSKPFPKSLWAIITGQKSPELIQLKHIHAPYYALRFIKDKSSIINDPYKPITETFHIVNLADIPDEEKALVLNEIRILSLFNLVHTDDTTPNTYYIHTLAHDFYKDKTKFGTTYTIPGLYWGAFIPRLHLSETTYLAQQLDHILHRLEETYSDEILYGHSPTGALTRN